MKYDDMINLPRHVSKTHKQMSIHDRAAQFAPFAALTGYEEAIEETSRLTEMRPELDAGETEDLNEKMGYLSSHLKERLPVQITYFIPDASKQGGMVNKIGSVIHRIDETARVLLLYDKTKISFDDLLKIEILEDHETTGG